MSARDKEYVCKLTAESERKAIVELEEDPENRLQAVESFRNLLKTTAPHICCGNYETSYLLKFLRVAKWNPDHARARMEKYMELFNLMPEWMRDIDVRNTRFLTFLDTGYMVPLGKDSEGREVILFKFNAFDTNSQEYNKETMMRFLSATLQFIILDENIQVNGILFLGDLDEMTLKHRVYWNVDDIRKIVATVNDVFPTRWKEIYFYKHGALFETFYNLFAPFLKKKIKSRIHFCGSDFEQFTRHVEKRLLPLEYLPRDYIGPNNGSKRRLVEKFKADMLKPEVVAQILYESSFEFRIDESKRIKGGGGCPSTSGGSSMGSPRNMIPKIFQKNPQPQESPPSGNSNALTKFLHFDSPKNVLKHMTPKAPTASSLPGFNLVNKFVPGKKNTECPTNVGKKGNDQSRESSEIDLPATSLNPQSIPAGPSQPRTTSPTVPNENDGPTQPEMLEYPDAKPSVSGGSAKITPTESPKPSYIRSGGSSKLKVSGSSGSAKLRSVGSSELKPSGSGGSARPRSLGSSELKPSGSGGSARPRSLGSSELKPSGSGGSARPRSLGSSELKPSGSGGLAKLRSQGSLKLKSSGSVKPTATESSGSTKLRPTESSGSAKPRSTQSGGSTKPKHTESSGSAKPKHTESSGSAKPRHTESSGSAKPRHTESSGSAQPRVTESGRSAKPRPTESSGSAKPKHTESSGSAKPRPTESSGSAKPKHTESSGSAKPKHTESSRSAKPKHTESSGSAKPRPTESGGSAKPRPTQSGGSKPRDTESAGSANPRFTNSDESTEPRATGSSDLKRRGSGGLAKVTFSGTTEQISDEESGSPRSPDRLSPRRSFSETSFKD